MRKLKIIEISKTLLLSDIYLWFFYAAPGNRTSPRWTCKPL